MSAATAVFRIRGKIGADAEERFGGGDPAKVLTGRAPAPEADVLEVGRKDAIHADCAAVVPAGHAIFVAPQAYLASVGLGLTEVHVAIGVVGFALEAAALPETASVVGVRRSGSGSRSARAVACVVTRSAMQVAEPQILAFRGAVHAVRRWIRTSARWRGAIDTDTWLSSRTLVPARAAIGIVVEANFTSSLDETIAVHVGPIASHDAATFDAIEERTLSVLGTGRAACAAVLRIRPEVHVAKELRRRAGRKPRGALVRSAIIPVSYTHLTLPTILLV